MGTMASGERVWAEKGYVPGKDRGGVLWGGITRQKELRWVQLNLTFLLDLIDRRSSFPAQYQESVAP